MSDQQPKEPEKVLAVLFNKESRTIAVRGNEYKLFALTFNDLADLEGDLGAPLDCVLAGRLSFKVVRELIWLGVRRNGLSKEQIDNAEWQIKPREVGDWFSFTDMAQPFAILTELMMMTGIPVNIVPTGEVQEKNSEGPESTGPEQSTTQAQG